MSVKLLVSPKDLKEALSCIKGGADIVDVKNPREGSLGGHFPEVIKKIRALAPREIEVSAAVGDVPDKPGLVSQAALGVALCGVQYIKIGLFDDFTPRTAVYLVRQVTETVKSVRPTVKVVICGYADASAHGVIAPRHIPAVVHKAGANVAMIDTFNKKGSKTLFNYTSLKQLKSFASRARSYGLQVALAGNLQEEDVMLLQQENLCDFIGIRTLACRGRQRSASIDAARVRMIKKRLYT